VLSAIAIYRIGAPLLLPSSSQVQHGAFKLLGRSGRSYPEGQQSLDDLWFDTQNEYSVNAQMSRNVIKDFILLASINLQGLDKDSSLSEIAYTISLLSYFMKNLFC
jgi:hypothetical protein